MKNNKKGASTNNLLLVTVITIVVIAGILAYSLVLKPTTQTAFTNTVTGSSNANTTGGVNTIVTTNPTVSVAAVDAQQIGTSVGVANSPTASTNGAGFTSVTLGTTTAVPGQSLALMLKNASLVGGSNAYHDLYVAPFSVGVGSFPLNVQMNKNASVTENIYTTTGVVIVSGGSGQNQTSLGNGVSYTLKDEMTGTSLASTQDMSCVIELTDGVNASTNPQGVQYDLNGNNLPTISTSTPAWYTPAGTNSRVWIFAQPALNNGAVQTLHITVTPLSNKRMSAGDKIIKTCYTKEWFIDSITGKPTYDVADSNNNLKNIAQYTYTVNFA